MKRIATAVIGLFLAVVIPFLLVLTNVNVFMTPPFLNFEYARPGFPHASRYDDSQRARYAIPTLRYARGELSNTDLANLEVFNDRELSHMRDVQVVATNAFNANYFLAGLVILAFLLLSRLNSLQTVVASIANGAKLTLGLMVGIALFAWLAFDEFFVAFHSLFFADGTWTFRFTDSLIQFYPETLWIDAALGISLLTLVEALFILLVIYLSRRRRSAVLVTETANLVVRAGQAE